MVQSFGVKYLLSVGKQTNNGVIFKLSGKGYYDLRDNFVLSQIIDI